MQVTNDKTGQRMIKWEQAPGGWKHAWVQRKSDPDKDWAQTGRYLNVVRINGPGQGPTGNATDFPIFNNLPDDQMLIAFVAAVCGVTGCKMP